MTEVKRFYAPGLDGLWREPTGSPRELIPLVLASDYDTLAEELKRCRAGIAADWAEVERVQNIYDDERKRRLSIKAEFDTLLRRVKELEARPEQALADALAARLLESNANYIESTFECEGIEGVAEITVTMRREGGKTPHQLRTEAEQDVEKLQAENERLQRRYDELFLAYHEVCAEEAIAKRDLKALSERLQEGGNSVRDQHYEDYLARKRREP